MKRLPFYTNLLVAFCVGFSISCGSERPRNTLGLSEDRVDSGDGGVGTRPAHRGAQPRVDGGVNNTPDAAPSAGGVDAGGEDPADAGSGVSDTDRQVAQVIATLDALPDMGAVLSEGSEDEFPQIWIYLLQPVDHEDPSLGTFPLFMMLKHRDPSAPMVLNVQGYALRSGEHSEPTVLLEANELAVEHRFFGGSRPIDIDWNHLKVAQAVQDLHRVVEALRPLYNGPWISHGVSKGGKMALFHRRFFPEDVDATLAYVSPNSVGKGDERYAKFLETIGTEECREKIRALQREILTRRTAMLSLMAEYEAETCLSHKLLGGTERAFEAGVLGIEWYFWQYKGVAQCDLLPHTDASDADLFRVLESHGLVLASDDLMDQFAGYFYQSHTELGYPAVSREHLADLLLTDPVNLEEGVPPKEASQVSFDSTVAVDLADWVAEKGSRLMLIYGEFDPYTAGAFELGNATESYRFDVPQGTHAANIGSLPLAQRARALSILRGWAGLEAMPD